MIAWNAALAVYMLLTGFGVYPAFEDLGHWFNVTAGLLFGAFALNDLINRIFPKEPRP